MKALITGATSGIGLAIAKKLNEAGWEVWGLGRDIEKVSRANAAPSGEKSIEEKSGQTDIFGSDNIRLLQLDFLSLDFDHQELSDWMNGNIPHDIDLLVNAAGLAYYGLHGDLSEAKFSQMVKVNLLVPMILSQVTLSWWTKSSKKTGTIINISSITAEETSPHGAAYGATKAGLSHLSESLYAEYRKQGIRVVTIEPDLTVSDLYRHADFTADDSSKTEEGELSAALLPEDVANAVLDIVNLRAGMNVNKLVLTPQLHKIKKK